MLHDWSFPEARRGFFTTPDPVGGDGHLFECSNCGEMRRETDFTAEEWPVRESGPVNRRGEPLPSECHPATNG